MFIVEEKILGNYYLNPMKVVGWEGIWGVCFYVVFLVIAQIIPKFTPSGLFPYGKVEDSFAALREMFSTNLWIFFLAVCTIFSIASFNSFGLSVTKFASAAQRSTIDTSRTVFIWLFCLLMPSDKVSQPYWS